MKLALSTLCENPHRRTGLTTLFHEFVRHALRAFPDVRWIVVAGPEQEWQIMDERVEVLRQFPSNERKFARLWADHFRVAAAVKRRGADALLTIGFVPVRTAGLPVIMHLFSFRHERERGLQAEYRRRAVQRGMRRAALVIVNSEWAARQLPPLPGRLLVSYEGLQHDRFSPAGKRGVESVPSEYLLWAGNFYRYKRAEFALAAYANLPSALRARFPLVLVGGDWEGGRSRAQAEARRLGIEADTRFVGWVDDEELPKFYRGARAQVVASSEETFGRSVAEAMACGCPSVMQDIPVLREVTAGAGIFVDYGDTTMATAALERICTDNAWVARLRDQGLQRAAAFSFERLAKERITAIRERLAAEGRLRGN